MTDQQGENTIGLLSPIGVGRINTIRKLYSSILVSICFNLQNPTKGISIIGRAPTLNLPFFSSLLRKK